MDGENEPNAVQAVLALRARFLLHCCIMSNSPTIPSVVALVLLLLMPTAAVRAQDSNSVMNELRAAVMQADAQEMARLSASTVEIAMFGESKRYSRGQAALLLRSFFADYPPLEFAIADFTKTATGWFMEGSYIPDGDRVALRVYIRLRRYDNRWLVRELLIEEAGDDAR